MIALRNVVKSLGKGSQRRDLLEEANFVFSEERMGLAVGTGEEAELVLDLLCGIQKPEFGTIWRDGRPSWPIGRVGHYRADLTGKATLHFLASIYQFDFRKCEDLLFGLVDIGKYYNKAMIEWPRNLILEFSYATALMPNFEIYMVEGSMNTVNESFNEDFDAMFEHRIRGKQLIYYSTSERFLMKYVHKTACLLDGHFYLFEEVADALTAIALSKSYIEQTLPTDKPKPERDDIIDM